MEIHQLRYIVALAQERNFLRAAERVHVTQPTLSHQVKKLEKELKTVLFERSPRHVRLTVEGEKFIANVQGILDSLDSAVQSIQETSKGISGRLRVGFIPTIGPYLIPPLLKKLKKKAPQLILELHELTTSILVEHLKEGRVDLGVLALPIEDKALMSQSLGTESFYLAVSQHHRLTKKRAVTTQDVVEERVLVLQEGHCFRNQSLDYCHISPEDPQVIFQGSSLSSVMKMAAADQGVTFVPEMAAESRINPDIRFIPFKNPKPQREIGLVWRATSPISKAQTLLSEVLSSYL